MAAEREERKISLDQVLKLIAELTPSEQQQLSDKLAQFQKIKNALLTGVKGHCPCCSWEDDFAVCRCLACGCMFLACEECQLNISLAAFDGLSIDSEALTSGTACTECGVQFLSGNEYSVLSRDEIAIATLASVRRPSPKGLSVKE